MSRALKARWLAVVSAAAAATLVLTVSAPASAAPREDRERAGDAVAALAALYDPENSRFDPGPSWWETGNSLQVLIDYEQKTHDRSYLPLIEHAVSVLRAPQSWWTQGGGDFRTDSTDDTGWYGLAMVSLYQLTHDRQYLEIAEEDEAYIGSYWDDRCGGGVIWDISSLSYKNAISNELYLKLAASLHNAIPGDRAYLSDALKTWSWIKGSGMINGDHLVNDGLTSDCANNGGTTWTYNQGVILGGLSELYTATKDRGLLVQARHIANAVISSPTLAASGILTEPCEAAGSCNSDQTAFKGIFVRNLDELDDTMHGHPYRRWIAAQAHIAWANDRNDADQYGVNWAGPFDVSSTGRQDSGAALMVAAL